ncbi:thioredoxin-like isoform X1 [Pteropus alecto]|uniref:Thioredoxin n=1 Tax=Pteropus alecto TaxID=9402 RepID=L5K2K1_PTEAL|nr:thioredoxin-like isoform X1 [Pteropus alecto]ELK05904.1 Thioredoxin [Pteropus alecto]
MVKQVERKYAFQEALNSAGDKLTVVDFSATWRGSCKMRKPPFHPPSERYSNAVFLDVKADRVIVRMLLQSEVECMPTFRFFFFLSFFFLISFSITNLPVLKKGQKMDEFFWS